MIGYRTMKKAAPKILVFDSGLGGISILDAIRDAHPDCHFIYCTDNAAFPYGTKPKNNLIERVSKVMSALNSTFRPDADRWRVEMRPFVT